MLRYIIPSILIFSSCITQRRVSIDVLKASEIKMPDSVKSMVLAYPGDSIELDITSDKIIKHQKALPLYFLDAADDAIGDSPRFASKIISILIIPKKNASLSQYTWNTIDSVCRAESSEALLSIEYIRIRDTVKLKYNQNSYDYTVSYSIINDALYRLYLPDEKLVLDEYLMRDTFMWYASDAEAVNAYLALPSLYEALEYSCGRSANRYIARVVSYWESQTRTIYATFNTDMSHAAKLATKGRWDDAYKIWMLYARKGPGNIAAYAMCNLAVYAEINDEFDTAIRWLKLSGLSIIRSDVGAYLKLLEERNLREDSFSK